MKKLLALFLLLPLLFSCSSDDKEDGNDFKYIQLYVKYDDTVKVSYRVNIYKGDISDYELFNPGHGRLPSFATYQDGLFALPLYSSDDDMMDSVNTGYAVDVFFSKIGEEHYDGIYTIQFVVNVHVKGYFQCVKSFDIDKNTAIRLKFHKLTNFDKKDIEGDWQVVDASKENYRDLIDFD